HLLAARRRALRPLADDPDSPGGPPEPDPGREPRRRGAPARGARRERDPQPLRGRPAGPARGPGVPPPPGAAPPDPPPGAVRSPGAPGRSRRGRADDLPER